jgi:uncharacterized protein (UPF0335 family)
MADITIPGGKIRAYVERIENIDGELQELNEQKKEVFAEAKGEGFDIKILKEIVKLRKQDKEERDERESLLDLYMRAMEAPAPEKAAKAA